MGFGVEVGIVTGAGVLVNVEDRVAVWVGVGEEVGVEIRVRLGEGIQ